MDPQFLRRLYRDMLRIRMVEEAIVSLYPEQEMRCPVHLCIGQEAPPVGICAQLHADDYVLSAHRSHGHYLAKGGDLPAMMAELYGRANGCSRGRGGSMHLVDLQAGFLGSTPIVAATIPIAVGVAFGTTLKGERRVTVVFFGEGATEEGVFHESVNFAALKRLPVVFVCENNLYSVYSPLRVRQPEARDVCGIARAHGMDTYKGDGNDVVEVFEMARTAIERARRGGGPTLIELSTYRWREHCGPNYDNDLSYRTEAEFVEWKARCPVENFRRSLLADGILTESQAATIVRELRDEIATAIRHAKNSPFPDEQSYLENVYSP